MPVIAILSLVDILSGSVNVGPSFTGVLPRCGDFTVSSFYIPINNFS